MSKQPSIKDHLEAIRHKHGALTPGVVLQEARNPKHPLHTKFEWEDSKAAERFREYQAHALIKVCYMTITTRHGLQRLKVYVPVRSNLPLNGGISYEPFEEVMQDPLKLQLVLNEMEREWRQMKSRYEGYVQFWTMVREEVA